MQIDTQTENRLSVNLEVTAGNGRSFRYALEDNSSVFIGSSSTCGLRLSGIGVEDIHCMLLMSEGQLKVHGWHTGSTLLNEQPIEEETDLTKGDRLQVGDHQILIGGASTAAVDAVQVVEPVVVTQPVQPIEQSQRQIQQRASEATTDEPATDSTPPNPSQFQEGTSSEEEMILDFSFDPDEDLEADPFGSPVDASDSTDHVLQREVDHLRMELAQRDAEIAELRNQSATQFEDDETTIRLVNRLEDLLSELENSDERVLKLEQLLRLSDEATQAEREERSQLESWIREIEQRIGQRESESEAQQERLQTRLDETRTQLERAEAQVQRVLRSGAEETGVTDDSVVKELQHQNEELRSRLQSLTAESDSLRDQLENSDELEKVRGEVERLEQQMLQMEIETSRERAEIAREKAVIRRTQDEMEKQMREQAEMSDSDTRLIAMRQHLRERYEKEKAEREEQRNRGLGGRISRLLGASRSRGR